MASGSRTGGPKTTEGKLSVSRNAIKTGAYSSLIILPGESEEDFRQLEEQFIKDFSPQDVAEAAMVRSLSVFVWKKLRAEKLEHAAMIRTLNEPFPEPMFMGDDKDYLGGYSRHKLMNFVKDLDDEDVKSWESAFAFANKFSEGGATAVELENLEQGCAPLYDFLSDLISNISPEHQYPSQWLALVVQDEDGDNVFFLKDSADAFIEDYRAEQWALKNILVVRQEILNTKEDRLHRFLHQKNSQRVHDDLDRAFFRTLSELRTHQKWRRDQSAIVITQSED